ncbi:MAG: TonB-dependent receptor plug domain-containing protein, partial [Phycisphaerae bacterium]
MIHPIRCQDNPTNRIGHTLLLILMGIALSVRPCASRAAALEDPPDTPAEIEETADESALLDDEEDQEDIELLELEVPIVVTASRRAQKITSVPHAMSVVTAEDIRRSGARTIPDALRLVPGVDVADLTFGNSAVSVRGFHGFLSRQVLVLVDGRQIFDSHFGGTLWGTWPFQLEDIERIEVVRGPGGVTWGANAVNGVINILTKDPRDQLGLTYSAGGGSRGTYKTHLGYAFEDGKLRMRISGEYEASDGFIRGGSILRRLDDEAKTGRMGLHAIYEAGPDDTWTFSAGSNVSDGGFAPTPLAGFGLR